MTAVATWQDALTERLQKRITLDLLKYDMEADYFHLCLRSTGLAIESGEVCLEVTLEVKARGPILYRSAEPPDWLDGLRIIYSFRESLSVDQQLSSLKDFAERQVLAAISQPKVTSSPYGAVDSLARPTKLKRLLFGFYWRMNKLASRIHPFRLQHRLGRRVAETTKSLMLLPLNLSISPYFLRDCVGDRARSGDLASQHAVAEAVHQIIPRLSVHPRGTAILEEAFSKLFTASPKLEANAAALVLLFHHLNFPSWVALCLKKTIISLGPVGQFVIYLAWLPVRDYLDSRIGLPDWHQGRVLCNGTFIELAISDRSPKPLAAEVLAVFEQYMDGFDFRDRVQYHRIVPNVLLELIDLDRCAGRNTEADKLEEIRHSWLRDANIGFND